MEYIFIAVLFSALVVMGKKAKSLHWRFLIRIIQAGIVVFAVLHLLASIPALRKLSETAVMSSSLAVVVIGFACQKALEDFIAGVMISVFRPFSLGDRITLRELDISGYVEDITLRHTVIRQYDNSRLIVPNSRMNHAILLNSHLEDAECIGYIDASITYESSIREARRVICGVIRDNPLTIGEPGFFVRSLDDSGVSIRATARTKNIDDSFLACSQIREAILTECPKNKVEFAYPHVEVINNHKGLHS